MKKKNHINIHELIEKKKQLCIYSIGYLEINRHRENRAQINTNKLWSIGKQINTQKQPQNHKYRNTSTKTHRLQYIQTHIYTNTPVHIHIHLQANIHTHIYTHKNSHSHKHKNTYTNTHTQTQTHTHLSVNHGLKYIQPISVVSMENLANSPAFEIFGQLPCYGLRPYGTPRS